MMATEIRIPTLTESRNYELWKLQTQAWTFVTDMSKEKQALAVALNLPEDDKWKIKEKVFGELELDVLNSENGMSVLFEFLDEYLLEDELMDSWNKFEDFEKFQRKPCQNIREYVADFDLKFRKLEKLHIKLPPEILAFKLLRNANLSKQERMFVLTGVDFADKENMYKETKHSLLKVMGDLTVGKGWIGLDIKLEPAWRKSTSSSTRTVQDGVQRCNIGRMKKKLNTLGSDGKILLCYSCGSYRHLIAECPDSWENIVKRKTSEFNVELRGQSDEDKLKGEENKSGEALKLGEVCGSSVANKQLAGEVTQLKIELRNLTAEIKEIKAVKDKELKRQKEEFSNQERIIEQENEGQQREGGALLQEIIQSIMQLQKEIKLIGTDDYDRQISKQEMKTLGIHQKLNENNRTKQRLLAKARKVKLKLQMTQGRTKTTSRISEKQMKLKLNTDKTNQVRQWFWWPIERQQLNDMAVQMITENFYTTEI